MTNQITEAFINHLWQSTLFACAAAMLTLAFRKNAASVRFRIWFAASVKFLIPFPLFVLIGKQLRWDTAPTVNATKEVSEVVDQLTQPGTLIANNFSTTPLATVSTHWQWNMWELLYAIWLAGFVVLLIRRVVQWQNLRVVVDASSPLSIEAPIPVRETNTLLEPGIFGVFSPTLLLPSGIAGQLTPEHLNAIVAHELCHWRRKDNLTAMLHMIVETLFWFYPLVWWLGGRMIVERERACDEAVIHAGNDRQTYAESILKVCQLYVEPPMSCIAGVSGGTLRKRIEEVMTHQVLFKLHFAKQCLLGICGFAVVAGPLAIGLVSSPSAIAQAQAPTNADATSRSRIGSEPPRSNPAPLRLAQANEVEMRHYKSSEWQFELDVPKRWNTFPPVSANSPFEAIRFASQEDGNHLLIVFRNPIGPKMTVDNLAEQAKVVLSKGGFSNFVTSEITIGTKRVVTLEFDKRMPNGQLWSCRQFMFLDGTLVYVLGFGTNKRDEMFGLFDRIANTFISQDATG